MWGTNSYIIHFDLDEFLELPQGLTMPMLFSKPNGCLAGMAYAQLTRRCVQQGMKWIISIKIPHRDHQCQYIDPKDPSVQFLDESGQIKLDWIAQFETCNTKETLDSHPRFNQTADAHLFHGTWPKVCSLLSVQVECGQCPQCMLSYC